MCSFSIGVKHLAAYYYAIAVFSRGIISHIFLIKKSRLHCWQEVFIHLQRLTSSQIFFFCHCKIFSWNVWFQSGYLKKNIELLLFVLGGGGRQTSAPCLQHGRENVVFIWSVTSAILQLFSCHLSGIRMIGQGFLNWAYHPYIMKNKYAFFYIKQKLQPLEYGWFVRICIVMDRFLFRVFAIILKGHFYFLV